MFKIRFMRLYRKTCRRLQAKYFFLFLQRVKQQRTMSLKYEYLKGKRLQRSKLTLWKQWTGRADRN